jgi:hypothetical protein
LSCHMPGFLNSQLGKDFWLYKIKITNWETDTFINQALAA